MHHHLTGADGSRPRLQGSLVDDGSLVVLERLQASDSAVREPIEEVILATKTTLEDESTAIYI